MSGKHDDLVGLALGALAAEDAARLRGEVEADPALRAELDEIELHLALHERLPELEPAPELWRGVQARIEAEPAQRSLLARFWMPVAAAALVAAAFFLPRGDTRPAWQPLHGDVATSPAGTLTCSAVSRLAVGDGVTITADAGTVFELASHRRLALRAGRVFLEVSPDRRGFTVEAGDLRVVTTGTAFEVAQAEAGWSVFVESGTVRCSLLGSRRAVGPGEAYGADLGDAHDPRAWFTRPSLAANILDDSTLRVVIRNEMPDTIQLAPPTGGEPLFFARYGTHDAPLAAPSALRDRWPATLAPGAEVVIERLELPHPLPEGERLFVSWPAAGLRQEARR